MDIINSIKMLHVVTDNLYYFHGVKNALIHSSEDGVSITVFRISVEDFLRYYKSEDMTSLYILAGPDSDALLSTLCDFKHFNLTREKNSLRDIPSINRIFYRINNNRHSQKKKGRVRFSQLQYDVLSLLFNGCDINTIAKMKNLSPKTVSHYKIVLKKKMHCNSDMELIKLNPILNIIESRFKLNNNFIDECLIYTDNT
ncbi:helix-turn-helix transcriptional regulator [Enterobacter roggenkampii]|uniref:helix-turn-helix transcriptional regulator n=1 Tax=Enterobacter roggenkampii TaxID=1812935 RepID=UPI002DB90E68|nr:LuxR C-terminal-related transcriptional regulator [Enterobacter roggenkampii]MEB6186386.1 LuxR C-terminal-related transcriptional regulator [Enterobacter roggenkampii]